MARAPKTGAKPYYFADGGSYTGEYVKDTVVGNAPSAAAAGPWGNSKGFFWEVFAPDVAGIKQEERVNPSGAPGELEPQAPLTGIDLFATHTPGTPPITLRGAFMFTLKLKVYITDPSAAPAH